MSKRKIIFILACMSLLFWGILVSAQNVQEVGQPNPNKIGVDAAQQKLKEVSVTKFEDAGFWYTSMPGDQGIPTVRRFPGGPIDKEPIEGEKEIGLKEDDLFVLGVKVDYFKRGMHSISLFPSRPIPIEGITKTLSLWVVGRNTNHTLKIIVADHFDNVNEITVGRLNFTGWKKLTVAVPTSLKQRDYHYNNRMGIQVLGFRIDCDIEETYGSYYFYMDDMRAVTDLFAEESRDIDDMPDTW